MAQIELAGIHKYFGKVKALDGIDLNVKDKEFFVLFGPAGAGKTTILKTIAGVEFPDRGLVKMGGDIVNLIEPAMRNVSMVFENYALYPHMTVFDNIASPMRSPLHRKSEAEIRTEVTRVASMMGIGQLLERLPSQLSNGQRQRTALGRCLVRQPNVFLMDEPLAHLDAKLRHMMRTELKAMQAQFDTTTIYVTHDYTEALSLGDRIAIINEGKIIQVAAADEIYYTPTNEFVARLVGEPEINIVDGDLVSESGVLSVVLTVLGQKYSFPIPQDMVAILEKSDVGNKIRIGIRGVNLSYGFDASEGGIPGTVYNLESIGNKSVLTMKVDATTFFQAIAPNDLKKELDTPVYMRMDMKNALFFRNSDGRFLGRHNQAQLIGRG